MSQSDRPKLSASAQKNVMHKNVTWWNFFFFFKKEKVTHHGDS